MTLLFRVHIDAFQMLAGGIGEGQRGLEEGLVGKGKGKAGVSGLRVGKTRGTEYSLQQNVLLFVYHYEIDIIYLK